MVSSKTALYGTAGDGFELWGVGAVQEIDNAAMSVWLSIPRHRGQTLRIPANGTEFQLPFQFGGVSSTSNRS